jgi:DNA-binding MarR family transcriptional regulator/GNAT superfamily N-acetyltransferase
VGVSRVDAVRGFNRFYTRRIGVLGEGHLHSPFSLTEVRILYEVAHRNGPIATELARDLGLDPGYLSRILLRFQKRGLLARKRSKEDGRQNHLFLTKNGRKAFLPLERDAGKEVAAMLGDLSSEGQRKLVDAMRTIEELLGASSKSQDGAYMLRPHRPGDIGWVIHRHGALYAQEYGWDETFEALVAEIAAKFIQNFDPKRERCWIAEKDGEIVGSIFLVKQSETIAKLRLLLVEPSARGLGIGQRLVEECVRFARQTGYKTITLWTQNLLHAARHIYEKAGFRLVREEPNSAFGAEMTSQTWELTL